MRFVAAAAFLGLFVLICFAQGADPAARGGGKHELVWRVPFAEYLHFSAVESKKLEAGRKLVADVDKAAGPYADYVHAFGYEISPEGVLGENCAPLHWEDLAFQLAACVPARKTKEGKSWQKHWSFARLYDTPALELDSTWTLDGPETYDGHSALRFSGEHLLPAPPALDEEASFSGWRELRVATVSWFDAESGVLRGFRAEVHGYTLAWDPAAEEAQKKHVYHDWEAEWRLDSRLDSTDEDRLRKRVGEAIRKSIEWLKSKQNGEGLWPDGSHKRGGTAVALLALLMGDVPANDPCIRRGFQALAEQELENVYSVGISLMAYEARYITPEERRGFLEGRRVEMKTREVGDEDRAEMQRLVQWLNDNRNRTNPFWNYSWKDPEDGSERFDFSLTQYALLGYSSALRCGIEMPEGFLREFVERLLRYQEAEGPEVKRVIGGSERDEKSGRPKASRATKSVQARGWEYYYKAKWDRDSGVSSAYGSMTCSGITCLLTALDMGAMLDVKGVKREFQSVSNYNQWRKDSVAALEGALAWMDLRFSATRNANKGRRWYLYYLYGLERVGILGDLFWMGEHDWYAEGASVLVTIQEENGAWGSVSDTAFGLLFLKKGSIPISPVTGE